MTGRSATGQALDDMAPRDAGAQRPALLYVLHAGNLYGTERVALATAQALSEYDRRIILAPPGHTAGSALDEAARLGMEGVSFTDRRSLLGRLRAVMAEERQVDVVTTSITQSLLVSVAAATTRCRIRHLHAVHGDGDATSFRWKPILLALRMRYLAVSSHVRDLLVEAHVPARRIVMAENFLEDAPPGTAPARVSYGERPPGSAGPVRVVVVGRADEVKRLGLVIDAVAEQGLTEVDIDVYGAGPLLESLRSRAAPFANLTFRGYDADVAAHLARADLLLHTCPVETFGLVVLESFRAGVVPIVPDAGGTATLVEPGRTGFRYRAGDAVDLVRSVRIAAAESPARLDDMVAAAQELMRTRFSADEGARVYRRAFAQLGR